MISLNLLPDVKKQLLKAKRERNIVIFTSMVAMIGSGALLIVLGAVMAGQAIHKATMEGNIKRSEATIAKDKSDKQLDKYLTIQNQLKQIDGLKSNQQLYSRVFDYVMQLNPAAPNDIRIKNLTVSDGTLADPSSIGDDSANGSGSVTIDGRTASYASLNVFKTTAEKAKIVYTPDDGTDDSSDDSASTDATSDGEATSSSDTNADGNTNSNNPSTGDNKNNKEETELLFSKVSIVSQSLQRESTGLYINFQITMVYNKNAFAITSKNVRLDIPKETTSDADQNAPKMTDIFTNNDKKDSNGEDKK